MLKAILKHSKMFGKNSILIKLFISYALIITISILPIGIFSINYASGKMERQAEELSINILQSASSILDEKMRGVYNESYNISTNLDIKELMEAGDVFAAENTILVSKVADYLDSLPIKNELISDGFIWLADKQAVVSKIGREKDESFFSKTFSYKTDEYRTVGEMIIKNESDLMRAETPQGDNKILLIYSLDWNKSYKTSFLVIELSKTQIDNVLKDVTYGSDSYLAVVGRKGVLLEKGDGYNDFDYRKVIEENKTQASENKTVISKIKSGKNYVLATPLSFNEMIIVSVIESSHVTGMIRNMVFIIVLVCIVLCFICIFMASYMSMHIYGPVSNVLELIKIDREGIGEKTKDEKTEMDFLKKTIQTIINKSSDAKDNNEVFIGYVREQFFYWFAKKYISDETEMINYIKELELDNISQYFTVAAVRIDNTLEVMEKNSDIQLNQLNMYIKNLMAAAFTKAGGTLYGFFDERIVGIIVLHNGKMNLNAVFADVQKEIMENFGFSVSICYSKDNDDWKSLSEDYSDVTGKLAFYSFNSVNKLIYSQNCDSFLSTNQMYYNEDKIERVLSDGNEEDVIRLIDEMFEIKANMNFDDVRYIFNYAINAMVKCIYEADIPSSVFFDDGDPYDQIKKFNSIYEVSEYLKKYSRKIVMLLRNHPDGKTAEYNKFISYIEKNYMKDIDLVEASMHFGYSSSYFSRYFKRIVGSRFNETLNQYRIDMAKKILSEDKMILLSTVSEKVGFVNYKTFNQVFKNIVGVTPSVYQKNVKNN